MKTIFRATTEFIQGVRRDLARPHPFAAERVSFISTRAAHVGRDLILIAEGYHPVADEDYVVDPSVGAMMGQEAIRKSLEIALLQPVGMFHVHMHEHLGRPAFSRIDIREQLKFVPDFFKVRRDMPHGAIVLSHDKAAGSTWLDAKTMTEITEFDAMGWHSIIDFIKCNSEQRL